MQKHGMGVLPPAPLLPLPSLQNGNEGRVAMISCTGMTGFRPPATVHTEGMRPQDTFRCLAGTFADAWCPVQCAGAWADSDAGRKGRRRC